MEQLQLLLCPPSFKPAACRETAREIITLCPRGLNAPWKQTSSRVQTSWTPSPHLLSILATNYDISHLVVFVASTQSPRSKINLKAPGLCSIWFQLNPMTDSAAPRRFFNFFIENKENTYFLHISFFLKRLKLLWTYGGYVDAASNFHRFADPASNLMGFSGQFSSHTAKKGGVFLPQRVILVTLTIWDVWSFTSLDRKDWVLLLDKSK